MTIKIRTTILSGNCGDVAPVLVAELTTAAIQTRASELFPEREVTVCVTVQNASGYTPRSQVDFHNEDFEAVSDRVLLLEDELPEIEQRAWERACNQ